MSLAHAAVRAALVLILVASATSAASADPVGEWTGNGTVSGAIGRIAQALPHAPRMATQHFSGDEIVIVDGDTIALPCAVPARGCAEKVRLRDIDAPESYRPRCDNELHAGLAAKERLSQLLRGTDVSLQRTGKDVYGRTLGYLVANGADVGSTLVSEGLALPYSSDKRARQARIDHWCKRS